MNMAPIVPTSAPAATTPTTSTTGGMPSAQSLNNMFLQLLVAQLQNQNPTSPMDPSQFGGQLAQFSELSQVTSIYQLLQQNMPASGSGSTGGTPAAGSNIAKGGSPAVAAASSIVPTAGAAP